MNDPVLVGGFERLCDLLRDEKGFVQRDRAARNTLGERRAFDKLEDECTDSADVFHAMNCGDVRVVQRRQHLRLALEPRQPVRIGLK